MSWMSKLYETYQQSLQLDLPDIGQLMPISHTLQNAHINIVIDGDGNFKRAKVLEKMQIILPATEKSAGRSSGEAPHPLADKLQYVAKDYSLYGGLKKAYFEGYKSQLRSWCESEYCHPKAQAVYQYINQGRVIEDLINFQIIYLDEQKKLLTHWPYELTEERPIPLLFKILPKDKGQIDLGSALVCWTIEMEGDANSDSWLDISLQESWVKFDATIDSKKGFCFVKGDNTSLAVNHPAKIRHTGDKAKLISANDMHGYTYRGRFNDETEAVGVGFEVTQKAHNALRWLLSRQGYRNGDQRIVAWAVSGKSIPEPLADTNALFDDENLDEVESDVTTNEAISLNFASDAGQLFALKLNKKMAGYRAELGEYESIVIMAIDSATPGRMGITYYRESIAKEFIDRLECWHLDFSWQQRHSKEVPQPNGKKPKMITIWPISTPAPYVIADATYGKSLTDSLKKNLYERLMPCILEGRPFPVDILNKCINRVSNRNCGESWEWERNLGVACALYRGFYRRHPIKTKRRNYSMTLETNNTSRDYLYGRLLAIAERIESVALAIANESRMTTAERLMQRFSDRPFSTWRTIELALKPYMQRLQAARTGFLTNRQKELDEIMSKFDTKEFTSDQKLSGEFLLAYHCQRQSSRNQTNLENE
ncbi:TPA: type I-C CRISPR-associated protein Cas8c/Csd1 [Legionella pneumophila subsp. pneumophila]|nr:type I-C CRISPR-associated protein Cas8c/Csd1 [Legionella pneumophila subsp. pneumophila]